MWVSKVAADQNECIDPRLSGRQARFFISSRCICTLCMDGVGTYIRTKSTYIHGTWYCTAYALREEKDWSRRDSTRLLEMRHEWVRVCPRLGYSGKRKWSHRSGLGWAYLPSILWLFGSLMDWTSWSARFRGGDPAETIEAQSNPRVDERCTPAVDDRTTGFL